MAVYLAVAPSIGVVYLLTETRKWARTQLGFTCSAQTWSVCMFFHKNQNGMVNLAVAPSTGVVHLVTEQENGDRNS